MHRKVSDAHILHVLLGGRYTFDVLCLAVSVSVGTRLVSGAILIAAILLGHIFGKNYFYADGPAASIAGAVSFTVIAAPEFLFGFLAGRKQLGLGWIFLIACLSSPLVVPVGGIVILFIAIVNGWP
jgi:hypothetical protein